MEESAAGSWVQGAAEDMDPRTAPGQPQLAVLASETPKSLAGRGS